MQVFSKSNIGDEINLNEIIAIIWTYKILIICCCAIGICFSGYKLINTDREFTATATFNLDKSLNSNFTNNGSDNLTDLLGLGIGQKKTSLPYDAVMGRKFIEDLDIIAKFQEDPYYNTYTSSSKDPKWKIFIKELIGWRMNNIDAHEAMWQGIKKSYVNSIELQSTSDGAIKILSTHKDAKRAADIANNIMNKVINDNKTKAYKKQTQQLEYLADTLSKSLSDLENTESKLKTFTLENTTMAPEVFMMGSNQLETLRDELSKTLKLHTALSELTLLLETGKTSQTDYLNLREEFPIVDQMEFRRVLGQNEIINSWNWPNLNLVKTVFKTLSERKVRLESDVSIAQVEAEKAGEALERYASLQRDAKIAEATYTVLIDQVKAQSIITGYSNDNTEIFEYASPPLSQSAPDRKVYLSLGALSGLLISVILVYTISTWRGVYYTRQSILSDTRSLINVNAYPLKSTRRQTLKDINKLLTNKSRKSLRLLLIDLTAEIHKNGVNKIIVTSLLSKNKASDVAKVIATYIQSDTSKIAIIDFSDNVRNNTNGKKLNNIDNFGITEEFENISILRPSNTLDSIELLGRHDLDKQLKSLHLTFDKLFLCADNNDAISLAGAINEQKTTHFTIVKLNKTKSKVLNHMRSLLTIQGTIHE